MTRPPSTGAGTTGVSADETRYRQMFERNKAIELVIDPVSLAIVDANPAACAFYGYAHPVITGMKISAINMLPEGEVAAEAARAAAEQRSYFQFTHRLASGQLRHVEVFSSPLDVGGRRLLYSIVHDVTAQTRIETALRESEAKYRLLFEASPQAMWVYDRQTLRFLAVNEAAIRRYGYSRAEFLNLTVADMRPAEDLPEFQRLLAAGSQNGRVTRVWRHRTKDGRLLWAEVTAHPIVFDGHEARLAISTDITERKRAEEALRESEERYRDLFENANDLIYTHDFEGNFTSANATAVRTYEYPLDEMLRMNLARLVDPSYLPMAREQIEQRRVDGDRGDAYELLTYTKSGRPVWIEVNSRAVYEKGRPVSIQGIARDITERKQNEQHLNYLASHDMLTGLANRAALEERLERALVRARRGQTNSLLFLDLDNFKLVNDTLGHAAGDQVLVNLAQVLSGQLREDDLLARLGGDEFVVLLEGTSVVNARQIAERMRKTVDALPFTMSGRSFDLGISVGVVAVEAGQDVQLLLGQAEAAMYGAKEQGRNRVMLYLPEEDSMVRLSEANQWCRRIKDALQEDRFMLYYQPIARLTTDRIEHYEALLRMCGEQGEIILPSVFIPAAERFGLMPPIDRWVVRHVVRTLQARPDVDIFMNLSGRSLLDDALIDFIENELRTHGVAAERMGIEITETAAVQDVVRAERWIRQIKTLGCRVALDDFGVGFTSFAHLRALPVDQIKIDGSFIRSLDEDQRNRDIVQAMHTVARSLGKETVAEFVENTTVMIILRDMGVTYGQGWYRGKAAPDLPVPVLAVAQVS